MLRRFPGRAAHSHDHLCSELRPHFSLASESDPADQDDLDDDVEPGRGSTHQSRAPAVAARDDTVATSGVSTLSSTVSHESHNAQRSVSMELGRMKLETNRLLEELLEKEREYQAILQQVLEEREEEIRLMRLRSAPAGTPVDVQQELRSQRADSREDPELSSWLRLCGLDQDAIDAILNEEFTLSNMLYDVTRDDLKSLNLRGGVLCKLWKAITDHRQKPA